MGTDYGDSLLIKTQTQHARFAQLLGCPATAFTDLKLIVSLANELGVIGDHLRPARFPCGEAGRMVMEDVLRL